MRLLPRLPRRRPTLGRLRILALGTVLGLAMLAAGPTAGQVPATDDADLESRIAELELRLRTLSTPDAAPATTALPDWLARLHLSGSANIRATAAETDSPLDEETFSVRDARLFLDIELERDIHVGQTLLIRDLGFSLEWNAVRRSEFGTDRFADGLLGETYIEARGILGSSWLHLQAGRVQLPLGENYLRYGRGVPDDPFVSDTVGGPWFWDEGIRLFGGNRASTFGYVASLTEGEDAFSGDADQELQGTLKLWWDPLRWLHVSASGMVSGTRTDAHALWLGEMFPTPFGATTDVPNYDGGVAIADGPERLDRVTFAGVDLVLTPARGHRIWLAGAVTEIDSSGDRIYDRRLYTWIAEYVVEGEVFSSSLADFYLGVRGDGLGTYHDEEGYFTDVRLRSTLGFNVRSTEVATVVVGWRIGRHATLRAEYSASRFALVRGVTPDLRAASNDTDAFHLELGIEF